VLSEKLSGARFDRPQLRKAIAALGKGDVLIITRLDRLARSTRDLLNILHEVGECGAAFKSLADAWADTTTPHGKLMVTILGGLAEFERSLIKARTDIGIRRARETGVKFGRPSKLIKHQQAQAPKLLDTGEPQSAVARLLNVDQSTISRLAARLAA
jgi:DNA invertase Pin-like site-specific DNA recombinase